MTDSISAPAAAPPTEEDVDDGRIRRRSGPALDRRRPAILMFAALLIFGLLSTAFSERLPVNDGFGWDGRTYASWARDFNQEVLVRGVNGYESQRIVPSAVVHYSLRLTGVERNPQNIVRAFQIYNLALLLLTLIFWLKTADALRLSERGRWIGFLLMFVSFGILKHTFYNPVLTDTTAFALGMAVFWAYATRRQGWLLLATAIGAFTWPIVVYVGLLLFVFPSMRGEEVINPVRTWLQRWATPHKMADALLAGAAASAVAAGACLLYYVKHFEVVSWNPIGRAYVPISVLCVMGYVFLVVYVAASTRDEWMLKWRRDGLVARAALALGLLVVLRGATILIGHRAGGANPQSFLVGALLSSIARPLVFLVAHVTYYGVLPLLLLIFWRRYRRDLFSYGAGLTLVFFMSLVLLIHSESREALTFVVPLLTAVVVLAADRFQWSKLQYGVVISIAVLLSKVWLPINVGPRCGDSVAHLCYPRYFLNLGPWMTERAYLIQTVLVIAALLALTAAFRYGSGPGSASSAERSREAEWSSEAVHGLLGSPGPEGAPRAGSRGAS